MTLEMDYAFFVQDVFPMIDMVSSRQTQLYKIHTKALNKHVVLVAPTSSTS